jgi:hypothetical protein
LQGLSKIVYQQGVIYYLEECPDVDLTPKFVTRMEVSYEGVVKYRRKTQRIFLSFKSFIKSMEII